MSRGQRHDAGTAVIAVGYARRSKASMEDERHGRRVVSVELQRERIAEYAADQRWTLIEIVTDDGVSGGRRERLDRLAARVKATRARRVVVYHLDRFARDVAGMLDALRAFDRRGVELHVVGRGRVEAATASGFLATSIEGVVSEHFRRVVAEKTRDALHRLRGQGRRVSRFAPYGFQHDPTGQLIPEPMEQAALAAIASLSGGGMSLRALADKLAAQGFVARNGQPFRPHVLARLIRGMANGG